MPVKVLIVLDDRAGSGYRFGDGAIPPGIEDFTYITLVNALTAAGMQVSKAHRATDSTADPDKQMFNFAAAGVNLLDYDVIWLIGFEGRNDSSTPPNDADSGSLDNAQLNAIANFMDHGGGVFATGDHDSIGAVMSGRVPRVRAMRCWYGQDDGAKPSGLTSIPDNFPPLTAGRADTTRANPDGMYTANPSPFVWFENQSDSIPQPIAPTAPTHTILRRNGADIVVYPDHMHEGMTLGNVPGHDYTQNSPFGDTTKAEFREMPPGHRELPRVIATAEVLPNAIFTVDGSGGTETTPATAKTINVLSVYDGRVAGVGRVVTGGTFHHYVDINLTGDTDVVDTGSAPTYADKVGHDAIKGHGFNDAAPGVFDDIKAVFVNITKWLARPRSSIGLILERSTFSQDEVAASSEFPDAIQLTVDGLKPTQFPGGTPTLGPISGSPAWVPTIVPVGGAPIAIEPTFVSSDDPMMHDRLQRFTFKYRVRFTGPAFGFSGPTSTVQIQATLNSTAVSTALTDTAWLQLVKSANPFMLDLADGNETTWLSSDIKIFHVITGTNFLGVPLPTNATRDQALDFIRTLASNITTAQFTALPSEQDDSSLSSLEMTIGMSPRRVYNFALARVRLSSAGADANQVRVFFRIFTTQTTAALTYNLDSGGVPIDGYLKSTDPDPIALPGTQNGGSAWVSFPFFARTRTTPQQQDTHTIKDIQAGVGFKVYGALIDNNLPALYLTQTPTGGPMQSLPTLMMGEHQCIVAQIEYATAPIPDNATPWTSDKLSQRNIALSPVPNPGLDASRVALHTFEIENTPRPIDDALPPDELVLNWSARTPEGTVLRIHIPTWRAQHVVDLADRFYPRHEIEVIDEHTIEIPGGGTRYLPIPESQFRQTGVISVELPLGIEKGQRFDVSVRQITNRFRNARIPAPKVQKISLAEADAIIARAPAGEAADRPRGIELGDNKVLITDVTVFDAVPDHALIIEFPDPEKVRAAMRDAGRWREPIGAFQLGMPVKTKGELLEYHMRLLSVMRWRTAQLPRKSRWRKTMVYYLDLLAAKVQAMGGNPFAIPATPDGAIPQQPGTDGDGTGSGDDLGQAVDVLIKGLLRRRGCWVLLLLLLIILLLLFWYSLA